MTYFYIDIETIPTQREDFANEVKSSVSAPKNMKKKETIDAWFNTEGENAKEEAVAKTSFNGGMGEIFCIGIAKGDEEPIIFFREKNLTPESEKEMLIRFNDYLGNQVDGITFVGHYISGFDLRFIYHRFVVHNIQPKFALPYNSNPWSRQYFDTMYMWAGSKDKVSLDNLCKYLDIGSPKSELDGSKVWSYVKQNRWQEVYDYCVNDIQYVRQAFKKLAFL